MSRARTIVGANWLSALGQFALAYLGWAAAGGLTVIVVTWVWSAALAYPGGALVGACALLLFAGLVILLWHRALLTSRSEPKAASIEHRDVRLLLLPMYAREDGVRGAAHTAVATEDEKAFAATTNARPEPSEERATSRGRGRYEIEELALFWESLDVLGARNALLAEEVLGRMVALLAQWALRDPRRAPANSDGIRVLKAPSVTIDGVHVPALRLAYFLDEQPRPSGEDGVVMLLHVEPYDERSDADVIAYDNREH